MKETYQSDKFEPIVQFFKTLKTQEPILSSKPEPVDQAVQTSDARKALGARTFTFSEEDQNGRRKDEGV